jgi:hypothetical protein
MRKKEGDEAQDRTKKSSSSRIDPFVYRIQKSRYDNQKRQEQFQGKDWFPRRRTEEQKESSRKFEQRWGN